MYEVKLPVKLDAVVRRYSGNGRKLGYPTANIDTPTTLTDGVYFGYADLDGHPNHPALIFIGVPTTMGDTKRRLEAHLLDISDKDYYGKRLKVNVCYYHRPNQKFDSIPELQTAMKADESAARNWFVV